MARACNIFVVRNCGDILAAFTVRHECCSWLQKNLPTDSGWRVERYPDGAYGDPIEKPKWTAQEFLELFS